MWGRVARSLVEAGLTLPLGETDVSGNRRAGNSLEAPGDSSWWPKRPGLESSLAELGWEKDAFRIMLRRENTHGLLREVDGEVHFYKQVAHWRRELSMGSYSVVLFPVTPHFPNAFAMYVAARSLDIDCLWFQPCTLAPVMFPRTSFEVGISDLESFAVGQVDISALRPIFEHQIESILQGERRTYIQNQDRLANASRSVCGRIRAIRSSLVWLVSDRFPGRWQISWHRKIPALLDRLLQILVPRALASSLREEIGQNASVPPPENSYAVFSLHYEPERTSVPEGGLHLSQIEQILLAKQLLPVDTQLVVREHPSQLSPALQGTRGRSPEFYGLVTRDFGLVLDSETDIASLVGGARCVFTGTGNVAIEAALAGVPVVYFGTPWWAGMPGSVSYGSLAHGDSLSELFSLTASVAEVVAFLRQRTFTNSVPGGASETTKELRKRFGPLPDDFEHVAADHILRLIRDRVTAE